jgi:sugar O-acyltransferase (sialic acid O-acetyltransferase NeuD family)
LTARTQLVVYGAGGHGSVVAEAARAAGFDVLGFLDDVVPAGTEVLGLNVLGDGRWLEGRRGVCVAHGIGANPVRERLTNALDARSVRLESVIHPSAVIAQTARVGRGSVVLALAVLNARAVIGTGAIVNTAAVVEHDVTVGDFAHVSSNATLAGGARLGRLAHLGANGCALPGKSIGERSVVGAGGVVVQDIPAGCVAVGVPARPMRQLGG